MFILFSFIVTRMKEILAEGHDFCIPEFGTFLLRNQRIHFLPAKEMDNMIRNNNGLENIDVYYESKRIKKRRKTSV